jgi:DNA polymerase III epsilon subunit-like protein
LDGGIIDKYHSVVKLPEGVNISPEASKVNGLTREICQKGAAINEFARSLFDFMFKYSACVFVGHNICNFDFPVLEKAEAYFYPTTVIVIDTKLIWNAWTSGMRRMGHESAMCFYARVAAYKHYSKANLEWLYQTLCGKKSKQEHRAMADCLMTLEVFRKLFNAEIVTEVLPQLKATLV